MRSASPRRIERRTMPWARYRPCVMGMPLLSARARTRLSLFALRVPRQHPDEVGQPVEIGPSLRTNLLGPRERVDGTLCPPDDPRRVIERRPKLGVPRDDEVLRLLEARRQVVDE